MTVLILARDLDSQVDRLVQALNEREVSVFRTDLAAFPLTLTLDARLGPAGWDGMLATEHRQVRLSEVRSVLYRHPSHFELADGLSRPERRHAAAEAWCGLGGVLSELEVLWVNHPARESDATKPRQLNVARKVGLGYPPSQVTNKSFGAFGFVITPDQEWIMLEGNPAGAYGWLEQALGLPITSALADLLANGANRSAH